MSVNSSASIFPFIDPVSASEELPQEHQSSLPMAREYAYDFEHNQLKTINGRTYLVEGNDAIKVWVYKALQTVRYAHLAYSNDYGNEAHSLIGSALSREILQAELKRFIVEALMVNPYITEVGSFEFEISGSKVVISFICKTIYGEFTDNYTQQRTV